MSPELRVISVLALATLLLALLGAGIFVLARGQMAAEAPAPTPVSAAGPEEK